MVAGLATLEELRPETYQHLNAIGQRIRKGLERVSEDVGIRTQVTGLGSIFHIHFASEKITDARSAARANQLLIRYYDINMANRGINLAKAHSSFCSVPLADKDVEQTLDAARETLTAMKEIVREVAPSLVV
jgi:glutamate-1-semialdehyde 2,1-aminomutase